MTQRTIVELIDDVDKSKADETVTFALDGVAYEIDLSSAHAEELRDGLGSWIKYARKAGRVPAGQRPTSRKGQTRSDLDEVRAWARSQGHNVSDRGRIARRILDAYDAAH